MRRRTLYSLAMCACLSALAAGCADSGVTSGGTDLGTPDTAIVDSAETDISVPDIAAPDTNEPDLTSEDAEQSSTCEPGEGCFGESCEGNDDCLSGICTQHMGEKVCSKTCDETCPQGWDCTLVGGGGDGQYVCVSKFSHLCLPCETSEGCAGDTPNACVQYGGGTSFCGGACDLDTPCPSGYACQEVESVGGTKSFQCMNTAGVCPCSNLAIASVLTTPCAVTNDIGTCEGVRTCTEDGLTACTASEATDEVCNGIDDDCNGLVDDGTCDDGNGCTIDTCAGADGCTYEILTEGECLDGDSCTIGDHCEEGVCVGKAIDCDDENPCTVDSCDGLGGCKSEPQVAACDDGDPCTLGDLCSEGVCQGTATLTCDDGNPCTDDSCGEAGCVYTANEGGCDDGNACTQDDVCDAGVCIGVQVACDDGNLCTTDSCDFEKGCVAVNNAQPCDDADGCTLGDVCAEGSCVSGQGMTCDDGNPCTDDGCDSELGCIFSANTDACDDKNSCTTGDACAEGNCIGLGDLSCDDGNPCTEDSCLANGGCSNIVIVGICDDGDACTVGDTCINGACESGEAVACDDGNPCTDEGCNGGDCVFTPNQSECDDDNACTVASACKEGACVATEALDCDDGNGCTDDACAPQTGCIHANNSAPCTDGNVCTLNDTCQNGSCETDGTLNCDDGSPCTEDSCDSQVGCQFIQTIFPCCDGGTVGCGDVCVNIQVDDNNCGGCGEACDDGEYCNEGMCQSLCGPNETYCAGDCVTLTSDIAHCGECNNACSDAANAPASCVDGVCANVCINGYADCNESLFDGCEINLTMDDNHCGECNQACPAIANGIAGCNNGGCGIESCDPGYDSCDGNSGTGCESSLAAVSSCGSCNNVCGPGETCNNGVCQGSNTSFTVLDMKDVSYLGQDYLLLKVGFSSFTSVQANWCYEYQALCNHFGYSPTGCGPSWNGGGYGTCKSQYGSYAPDSSLSCNPSGPISSIAQSAGYGDANGGNSFGFHYCNDSSCTKTLCSGQYCNNALSYIDSNQGHGYTVCIKQ